MNALGFDNDKYVKLQSQNIRDRISQFGGKLYLEFGGKLFDDYHASRVLPGFKPDSKVRMLLEMRDVAREIPVSDTVLDYVAALIGKTHPERENCSPAAAKYLRFGASPRAAQALVSGAKVLALMSGRYNASVNDIKTLAYPVLRHRIALNFEAVTGGLSPDDVIKLIIEEN